MQSITLRGHHLFCLLGYRGKGYSEGFCTNMTAIYETLRGQPQSIIEITEGPDMICEAFPSDQPNHCHNPSVYRKDNEILSELGLAVGSRLSWEQLCGLVADAIHPSDIHRLCYDCPWEPYGLCQEGVAHIREAKALRALP
ncbi:DUF1284 domain-containing protein [Paenibacillus glycanilyticus]|uniref:DUF1284 domain-containing protein n=1 Tax=Paenibacillus glycanilyticus TaxID=126569 RepID=UPI00203AEA4C|nr:DUF1284 domain-containing protein [Paenibacillus glycanilyticus]MCM3627903.1 DUF1284 domain-containing protein [Paenibacillus glycanilyticus]